MYGLLGLLPTSGENFKSLLEIYLLRKMVTCYIYIYIYIYVYIYMYVLKCRVCACVWVGGCF